MNETVERALGASRLFGALDAPERRRLTRGAARRGFARGEHVWRAGAPATHFTVIASGLVKIVDEAAEAIVGLFGAHESVGDAAVLQRGTYPAAALAASAHVELVRVDAAPVLAAMADSPPVAGALNRALLEHTRALREKIRIMSAGAVPQRLAALLVHLAARFGDELDDGSTHVPLALTRGELASLIGARPETTIRAVSRLRRSGLADVGADTIDIPSLPALEALRRGG